MLHWNCAANGIKTRMGVIGFNKWSDDHFQNGWHWLNETELFISFLTKLFTPLGRKGKRVSMSEWERESGCKEMWNVSQGYLKNESLPGLRTPQLLAVGYRNKSRFFPLPQLFPIWRHFTVQTWMWESDDLQESKWQSDSRELERRRRRTTGSARAMRAKADLF